MFVVSPYISFFTFFLHISVVGSRHPNYLTRRLFFCEVRNHRVYVFPCLVVYSHP
ncbi:hypothetical protein JB92DRAFT_2863336, partial [Gautieria morchelliformis]